LKKFKVVSLMLAQRGDCDVDDFVPVTVRVSETISKEESGDFQLIFRVDRGTNLERSNNSIDFGFHITDIYTLDSFSDATCQPFG
jgi:hypothetical protein